MRREYRRIDTSTGQSWDPRERSEFEGMDDYEGPQESYSYDSYDEEEAPSQVRTSSVWGHRMAHRKWK